MKLTIHQDRSVRETEVQIHCAELTARLQKMIEQICQFGFSLTGYQQKREFQLPLETICFIDSTDGRTFLYQEKEVYECRETLKVLEEKLLRTPFVRVSKNCMINTAFLDHVEPLYNHRLKAVLKNGENLIITRSYIEALRAKLKGV